MLSIKGREPFIRMQLWLSDANNVDRLQALKNERREQSKRRRSTGPGIQDNSSDTSSNDTSEFYTSNSPGPGSVGSAGAPPNKKQRVLFSEEQKEALRLAFQLDPYPNVGTIEFLATELVLSTRTITNWFHNHRMRLKQQVPHGIPSEPVPSRENTTNAPFDPVQFRYLLNQRLLEIQKERMGLSGVPLPYPPYFNNPNLAALIQRGLLSSNESELAAFNNAFKEQMSGLDLSMGTAPPLKRERDDYYDDDGDGDGDNNMSDVEDDDKKSESNNLSRSPLAIQASSVRSSRRKPAAPQWVNPAAASSSDASKPRPPTDDEVIINGVCVMQQANDFSMDQDTVRVDPVDARSDDEGDEQRKKSKSPNQNGDDEIESESKKVDDEDENMEKESSERDSEKNDSNADESVPIVKREIEESDRWDY